MKLPFIDLSCISIEHEYLDPSDIGAYEMAHAEEVDMRSRPDLALRILELIAPAMANVVNATSHSVSAAD